MSVSDMPEGTSGDGVLRAELRALGRADGVTAVRRLSDGEIADAWMTTWADGTSAPRRLQRARDILGPLYPR